MESDDMQPRHTGDKVLLSHRLSDSESEHQSDTWNSQLSPISSQPSLAELHSSPSDLIAASPDSPDGSCRDQDLACSPNASTIGPAASASSGSAVWADITHQTTVQDSEESHDTGSLKAESELLDPWDAPFDSSLPVSRPGAQSPDPASFLRDFMEELGTSVEPQRAYAAEAQRPQTAMAAMESRHQQPVGYAAHSLPSEPPSQLTALHSSLAGPAHQLHSAPQSMANQHGQIAQQALTPSNVFFGSQQPQASGLGVLHSLNQATGLLQPPGLTHAPSSPGLQLPLHVQQWLAVLANDSQQGIQSQIVPKQHAPSARTPLDVSSADAAKAATAMQEDLRLLRAELTEVKSKFAETQAALAQTQQQLMAHEQRQASYPTKAYSPEPSESVSPHKLRALQETLQDLHAEVAELGGVVHEKNAELDSLHRLQEQKGSEVQAALRQVASEAGRASRANSDLISCREACKALEDQLAQADRRMQNMAGEQHLLDGVIAKGRQENAALRSSCSRLQDELNSLRTQCQDAVSEARGSERTAVAREAEADALCKENTALKQQLRSLQQDCGRSRGACHAITAELVEVKDAFRQLQKAQAGSQVPRERSMQAYYQNAEPQQQGGRPAAAKADYTSYQAQQVEGGHKRQAWPAASDGQQPHSSPDLIRASRAVNKALPLYKMTTPWGQPEPVARHHHADTCPPTGVGAKGQACGAGSWSSDHASQNYDSPDATEPDQDQGNRPQRDRAPGSRARSHNEAATSARDESHQETWQQPAFQSGPSRSSPRANSNSRLSTAADTHPLSHPSKLAPTESAAWPVTAAPRLYYSQQAFLQGSDKDRANSHQRPGSSQDYHRVDAPNRDVAARDCGDPPAGLSNSHRSELQEHQHKLQRPSAERDSSQGMNSGMSLANSVPAARPYATEQSLKAIQASADLEDKLMKLNQEKAELEAEYGRMPRHAGRNLKERKRKTDIEDRFETVDHDVSSLRLQLKRLGLK